MREIKYIAIHCTATSQRATLEGIKRYWQEQLGWKNPGYHYLVLINGEIRQLLTDDLVSNGVAGYNSQCINVSYVGGIDNLGKPIDNRTVSQKESMLKLLKSLKKKYSDAIIQGHYQFPKVNKACPCFDAKEEYKQL